MANLLHSFHTVAKEKYQNLDLQQEGVEKSAVYRISRFFHDTYVSLGMSLGHIYCWKNLEVNSVRENVL